MYSHQTLILLFAICLDLFFGDKERWPHPVRWMGYAISCTCSAVENLRISSFWQGFVATTLLVSATWIVVYLLQWLMFTVSDLLYIIFSSLTIYFGISLKCLAEEASRVIDALESDHMDSARERLSRIVGRDTGMLDQTSICMAVIESVAENFVDGILAPFFYAVITGPAGCMTYKMINTLDAMIGYKNARYIFFGRSAARMDDAANWLPARISIICILPAAMLQWLRCKSLDKSDKSFRRTMNGIFMDRHKHSSPNSGIPEAAFAWCLGVRLGGPVCYGGRHVDYPYMNEHGNPPCPEDVRKAIVLLYGSSMFLYLMGLGISWFILSR